MNQITYKGPFTHLCDYKILSHKHRLLSEFKRLFTPVLGLSDRDNMGDTPVSYKSGEKVLCKLVVFSLVFLLDLVFCTRSPLHTRFNGLFQQDTRHRVNLRHSDGLNESRGPS